MVWKGICEVSATNAHMFFLLPTLSRICINWLIISRPPFMLAQWFTPYHRSHKIERNRLHFLSWSWTIPYNTVDFLSTLKIYLCISSPQSLFWGLTNQIQGLKVRAFAKKKLWRPLFVEFNPFIYVSRVDCWILRKGEKFRVFPQKKSLGYNFLGMIWSLPKCYKLECIQASYKKDILETRINWKTSESHYANDTHPTHFVQEK